MARDLYIDFDAATNGDGSASSPWNSWISWRADLRSGDTVNVAGVAYADKFLLDLRLGGSILNITIRQWAGRARYRCLCAYPLSRLTPGSDANTATYSNLVVYDMTAVGAAIVASSPDATSAVIRGGANDESYVGANYETPNLKWDTSESDFRQMDFDFRESEASGATLADRLAALNAQTAPFAGPGRYGYVVEGLKVYVPSAQSAAIQAGSFDWYVGIYPADAGVSSWLIIAPDGLLLQNLCIDRFFDVNRDGGQRRGLSILGGKDVVVEDVMVANSADDSMQNYRPTKNDPQVYPCTYRRCVVMTGAPDVSGWEAFGANDDTGNFGLRAGTFVLDRFTLFEPDFTRASDGSSWTPEGGMGTMFTAKGNRDPLAKFHVIQPRFVRYSANSRCVGTINGATGAQPITDDSGTPLVLTAAQKRNADLYHWLIEDGWFDGMVSIALQTTGSAQVAWRRCRMHFADGNNGAVQSEGANGIFLLDRCIVTDGRGGNSITLDAGNNSEIIAERCVFGHSNAHNLFDRANSGRYRLRGCLAVPLSHGDFYLTSQMAINETLRSPYITGEADGAPPGLWWAPGYATHSSANAQNGTIVPDTESTNKGNPRDWLTGADDGGGSQHGDSIDAFADAHGSARFYVAPGRSPRRSSPVSANAVASAALADLIYDFVKLDVALAGDGSGTFIEQQAANDLSGYGSLSVRPDGAPLQAIAPASDSGLFSVGSRQGGSSGDGIGLAPYERTAADGDVHWGPWASLTAVPINGAAPLSGASLSTRLGVAIGSLPRGAV